MTKITKNAEQRRVEYVSEVATGIGRTSDELHYMINEENINDKENIVQHLMEEYELYVPEAGAGSYIIIFEDLGFDKVIPYETSSSAGDWAFIVHSKHDGLWYSAYQSNKFPSSGFSYGIDTDMFGETAKDVIIDILLLNGCDINDINEDDIDEFIEKEIL